MQHVSCKTTGLTLALAVVLVGGVQAQQPHQQHHPGGAQALQQQPAETGTGVPAQPQQMQGMMDNMQGMMQHMQGMMERMHGMMGRRVWAWQPRERRMTRKHPHSAHDGYDGT